MPLRYPLPRCCLIPEYDKNQYEYRVGRCISHPLHTITPPSHYHTITLSHPPVTIFHGRYLHSSWNSSADAKKIGVGSISPRASRRGTVSFGIGHPLGCRAIDRKPPQGDATCTVEYGRALLPLMYLLHVSYNILVPGTWYPVISYVARLLSLAS